MSSISNGESGASVRTKLNAFLGGLQYSSVVMTSAQLKAIHTTPIVMVAAPGSNKLIVITYVIWYYHFVTQAYQTVTNPQTLTSTTDWSMAPSQSYFVDTASSLIGFANGNLAESAAQIVAGTNQPLVLSDSTNWTVGDGTLTASFNYMIIDV